MITKKEWLIKNSKRLYHKSILQAADTAPIYILGEMRSGTNMLMDCFEKSLCVDAYNETDPEAFVDYELIPGPDLQALLRRSKAPFAAFKSIADLTRCSDLMKVHPRSQAVWIFRNYDDVVNSALTLFKEHREYLRLILEEPERARWRASNLSEASLDLIRDWYNKVDDASARALIWYVRNAAYFEQNLDQAKDRILLVRYENLVRDPMQQMRQVYTFLDCPFKESNASHLNPRSVARNEPSSIDPSIRALCDEMFNRLCEALPS